MKNNDILPINLNAELENVEFDIDSIDDGIFLLDKPIITSTFKYPFRMDVTVGIICINGTTECSINLKPYTVNGPCLITILPGQIVEYKSISDDFSGLIIIMSSKFTDSLMPTASERLSLLLSFRENPFIPLDEETLERMVSFFEVMKKMAHAKDHPYRLEAVRYLMLAYFYGASDFHKLPNNRQFSHKEVFVEKFLHLVQTHHKEERGLEFYANKLNVTPKHLSKVIKETSGKPANGWIDDHVALEAKALLKSTNMTIQQISDELNFPSQSFFGKYFKRVTGMSPSEYKGKG